MRVISAGSATIDIIATIHNADIEQMRLTNRTASYLLMEPGRKIDAEMIRTFTGGGAVNAAISLARQGFEASVLIKVGDDINAEGVLAALKAESVDTSLVAQDTEHATAVSMLIASHDRDAAIFTHRGANGYLGGADFDAESFAGAGLVYITNLSNASADQFPRIAAFGKAAGAFVATNPGIRQLTRKTEPLFESLQHVDLFVLNAREARALVPKIVEFTGWDRSKVPPPAEGELVLEIEGFHLPASAYFSKLHDLGPSYVCITDGEGGAHLSVNGRAHYQPVVAAQVLGTTGAGDSFASTLAGALVRGDGPQRALALAAHNAASVVSHPDAQTGLLTAAELAARVGRS